MIRIKTCRTCTKQHKSIPIYYRSQAVLTFVNMSDTTNVKSIVYDSMLLLENFVFSIYSSFTSALKNFGYIMF